MRTRWLAMVLVAGCTSTGVGTLHSTIATVRDDSRVCLDGGGAAPWRVGEAVRFVRDECKPLNAKSAVVRCTPTEVAAGEVVRVEGDCAEVHVKSGAPASGDRVALLSR